MAESGQDKGRDDEIKEIFSDFSKQKNLEIEQEQKNKKTARGLESQRSNYMLRYYPECNSPF